MRSFVCEFLHEDKLKKSTIKIQTDSPGDNLLSAGHRILIKIWRINGGIWMLPQEVSIYLFVLTYSQG